MSPSRLLRCAASGVVALAAAALHAQAPPPPVPEPAPAARVQALIDEFIAVMPQDPTALRKPELRAKLAPKALPVLRRIRDYVAAHAPSELVDRVQEFVVFSLVLDEPGLREALVARGEAGDPDAALLLGSAAVIQATDATLRERAVAACAVALRAKPAAGPGEVGPKQLDAKVAASAVQCLAIAADLSAAEATQLAEGAVAEPLAQRLRAVAEQAARDPRRLVGKPFELTGKQLGGAPFRTGSLLGKVVVIDFWAVWCGPCVRSLPDLVQLRREHGDQLAIVGISCDNDEPKLRKFLGEHPDVDWTQLYAGGDKPWHPLATEYGITSIPRLFLIDRRGILRHVDAKQDLAALVRRYLAE